MYKIVKSIDFCYGHRLLNYVGPCANLHGHTGRIDVALASDTLNELGMVMDFSEIKTIIASWVDEHLDHTLLLNKNDPLIEVLQQQNERFYVMEDNPSAENIAKLIYNYAKSQSLPVVSIKVWESDTSFAEYFD